MAFEVEEGEIVEEHDDVRSKIDLDVAFSYLDERIERVLGDVRKDFEGVISAASLGPMYGGYGTFLPTYVRPPSILFPPPTPTHVTVNSSRPSSAAQFVNSKKRPEGDDQQLSQKKSLNTSEDQRNFKLPVKVGSTPKNSAKDVLHGAKTGSTKKDSLHRIRSGGISVRRGPPSISVAAQRTILSM